MTRTAPRSPGSCGCAAQRAVTVPDHLKPKGFQTIRVAGYRVIVEVALNNGPQPLPALGHGLVPAPSKLLLQLFQLCREALPDGLTHDCELAGYSGHPAYMREAQKVERLRLALATLLSVCGCETPELNQARLVRV